MNQEQYLAMVKETYSPDCEDHVLYNMVGVGGEAGEIVNMAQKAMRGDFEAKLLSRLNLSVESLEFEQRKKLIEEMGGLYYFFTALCWKLDIGVEDVRRINAEKLRSRLERGTIRGDGDER